MVFTTNTQIRSCHVKISQEKVEWEKNLESHYLTSCLPKFLPILKDRDCAESEVTKSVIKRSKGLRIKSHGYKFL
jgi:hypothetical protein